ncbi:MAG: CoA-binding protein [Gemmatimonadota bacterium]
MSLDAEIIEVIKDARTIAVVGCSPKPYRDSNSVARYLIQQGYAVVPVNPKHDMILGIKAFPDLLTAREGEGPIDIVDIFRASEHVLPHVENAIEIKTRLIWMQEGVVNEEAAQLARDAGIPVVMDECLRVRHRELRHLRKL